MRGNVARCAALVIVSTLGSLSPATASREHVRGDRARDCTMAHDATRLVATTFGSPRDDAPHPGYAIEWWRSFGRVNDTSGTRYDFNVNVSRFAIASCSWQPRDATSRWTTHDFISTTYELLNEETRHVERGTNVERVGVFGSTIATGTLDIDGRYLHLRTLPDSDVSRRRFALTWHTPTGNVLDIAQSTMKTALPLGPGGVMPTGTCTACQAYAYAYTRAATTGTIRIAGASHSIAGSTWFEHEYAHRELASNDVGWNRYEVSFDDGRDLDVRFTRDASGAIVATSGAFVAANGTITYLHERDASIRNVMNTAWRSDASGSTYPSLWSLHVGPPARLALATVEIVLDQESHVADRTPYFVGAIDVERVGPPSGDYGHGYVELTGYDAPLSL